MPSKQLPRPTTTTEIYLAAILDKLDKIGHSSPEYSVEVPGEIVIREPEKPAPVFTPLPDDFPGKDSLEAAGVIFLEKVPRTGAELTAINGIGAATANKIMTWFAT